MFCFVVSPIDSTRANVFKTKKNIYKNYNFEFSCRSDCEPTHKQTRELFLSSFHLAVDICLTLVETICCLEYNFMTKTNLNGNWIILHW